MVLQGKGCERVNGSERLRIMRENTAISETGSYTAADGTKVTLPENGKALSDRTFMLLPEKKTDPTECIRKTPFRIADNTVSADTITCIQQLRRTVSGEIIALNFANANVPGGGYRFGGDAQEESLCRCSLLYAAIAPHKEYYRWHRLHPTPFYSDRMLISPDIPIIRHMDGTLTAEPVRCTFVTCAAVNRRIAELMLIPDHFISKTMNRRIHGILAAMAERAPEAIVLGAFGCGAFGNRRKTVYPMIENAVNSLIPDHISVYFAVPRKDDT